MTIIRNIQPGDNPLIATIIRSSLTEFGVNKPGTVFTDESTDHLYELFQKERSIYYVAEQDKVLVGGAGIFPSDGLPENVCELVKMYLKKEVRGKGLGKELIDRCLEYAAAAGYNKIYLETFPELGRAVSVYEKYGFKYLDGPMGNTGHYSCNVWMLKEL
jgi:putative acetyltransferase